MDRFTLYNTGEHSSEDILIQAGYVCLYDGDQKTKFEVGTASLTPCRLIWADSNDPNCRLSLHHSLVTDIDRSSRNIMRSSKIVLTLHSLSPAQQANKARPITTSKHKKIKLSFRHGGDDDFYKRFTEVLARREWEHVTRPASQSSLPSRTKMGGIVSVERRYAEQNANSSQYINQAFEDLSALMNLAQTLVGVSKSISEKIRTKHGEISKDETVIFKSHLLSLGVADPVTKASFTSTSDFYVQLSRELVEVLIQPIIDAGGMMTLPDVYCRINRARGVQLISTEDLLNACKNLEKIEAPIQLRRFATGVLVLELSSNSVEAAIDDTVERVASAESLNAEQLANQLGLTVVLANERLLAAEKCARLCRDESIEGLRFHPNRFLHDDFPPAQLAA